MSKESSPQGVAEAVPDAIIFGFNISQKRRELEIELDEQGEIDLLRRELDYLQQADK